MRRSFLRKQVLIRLQKIFLGDEWVKKLVARGCFQIHSRGGCDSGDRDNFVGRVAHGGSRQRRRAYSELQSRPYPQPILASSNFSKFSDLKNSSFLLSKRFTLRKPISTNPSRSVRAVWYTILKIFFTSLIVIIFSGLSDE